MYLDPICQYVAQELSCNVRLTLENGEGNVFTPHNSFTDPFFQAEELSQILNMPLQKNFPAIYCLGERVFYCRFSSPEGDFWVGPVHIMLCEDTSLIQLNFDCDLSSLDESEIHEVYMADLIKYSLLLYNTVNKENLQMWDCLQMNFDTSQEVLTINRNAVQTIHNNQEEQRSHNPYAQEQRLLASIELGSEEGLRECWKESTSENLGTLSKDPVRNGKALAQYAICASARAAIRGGLPAENVLTLTDAYAQQVDELVNLYILESLVKDVELQLTQMVHEHRTTPKNVETNSNQTPLIVQCKEYIYSHLNTRLSLTEIAEALHVHPNYLGSLFRKQEGVSLHQFVMSCKIDHAKNLLCYSDFTYGEIANYLCFSSQSHLGAQFKNQTGMTMKAYQATYRPGFGSEN